MKIEHAENIKPGATEQLGSWVSGLSFEAIPKEVIEHAKLCLLDAIGCGLFGSGQQWGRITAKVALGMSGSGGTSTLIGIPAMASIGDAALVNGTAIHGYEIDDVHMRAHLHPGSVTIPAALALAESRNSSGAAFLTAMVAGYEVGARVGMCAGVPHHLRGFHPTGTHGCLCAAAASASILKLSDQQSTHALAIGATQAAGLFSAVHAGAMAKRMHAGRAAQSGVYAGLLAEQGFTGSPDVLETPVSGYMSTLADGQPLTPFTRSLGQTWETMKVGFKAHAACASTHTTIDALESMMNAGLTAGNLKRLIVRMSKIGLNNVGWTYRPTTVTGAQMNGYFAAAVKLLDGEAFIHQYRDERIADPSILALIEKMEFIDDPELDKAGPAKRHAVRVEAESVDGRTWQKYVEQRRGSAEHPLSRDEIERKFRETAGTVLEPEFVESVLQNVWTLEKLKEFSGFCSMLRGRSPATGQ